MNNIWNKVYLDDSSFFGEEPSDFAKKCYECFIQNNVKKIHELGCGQGRDSLFFSSNNVEVYAVDSSRIAIQDIEKKTKDENNCYHRQKIKATCIDVRQGLPFEDNYFEAVYSHMFYNMNFTNKELKFLFEESFRVLKTHGLLYFSVRSDKDKLFQTRNKINENEGIYEINGFQIRFFNKERIKSLLSSNFKIDKIMEDNDDLANLYLIFCYKIK